MKLLSDLIDQPIDEDYADERLVSFRDAKRVTVDESRAQIWNDSDYFCYVRESLHERVVKASEMLPPGYSYLIKEGFRPGWIQERSFQDSLEQYKKRRPNASKEEAFRDVSKYVAPIEVAGHPTGGAVDLTLVKDGEELFMGTRYNDDPNETDNATYTNAENISAEAKKLREILSQPLEAVGLVNYGSEWWHWSYGDTYWAFTKNDKIKFRPILSEDGARRQTNEK